MSFLLNGTATGLGIFKVSPLKLTLNKGAKCSFNSLLMVSGHSVMTPNPGVTQMICCCQLADITGKDEGKWSNFASTSQRDGQWEGLLSQPRQELY